MICDSIGEVLQHVVVHLDSVHGVTESSIRFVASGEIQKHIEIFEPFIPGLTNATVQQFCRSCVEPMGKESNHVHIIAPIRCTGCANSCCIPRL
uniref:Uncharacterized protein n=1 Tax=Rhizophora mucronata TaxID=61149 RepID=A0A2P2K8C0_RHIMU